MMRAFCMSAGLLVSSTVIAAIVGASGCATATGEISGGDARFDASEPISLAVIDGGPLGTGHTWAELYGDFFGNPRAACSGNGACHGDANQPGAQNSNYVCPLDDKDSCYESITSSITGLINTSDPASSSLTVSVLRHADGSAGNMPKNSAYGFTADDLARIQAWIAAGAPNDSPADAGQTGSSDLDAGDASD